MKPHQWTIQLFLFAALLALSPAMADVLTIPDLGNTSEVAAEHIAVPSRGLTMDEVREQFGTPNEIKPPVGNPPITRWIYEKFTVHFEQNYVIHTVVRK